jgi:hypothetical protein
MNSQDRQSDSFDPRGADPRCALPLDPIGPDPTSLDGSVQDIKLFLYLMPVFGMVPAVWTLNKADSTRQERNLSRVAIKLALGWLGAYMLLQTGAGSAESLQVPLLLTSSLVTSGYFVLNLWLMILLWQRQSVHVPLLGKVSRVP